MLLPLAHTELDGYGFDTRSGVRSPGSRPALDLRGISLLGWLCLVDETLMAEMKPSWVEGFCVFLGL